MLNNHNTRIILFCAITIFIGYVFPAMADVAGTLSATTDTVITWIRAAAAILIVYCIFMAIRTGSMLAPIGMVVGIAAAIGARDLAAIIQ